MDYSLHAYVKSNSYSTDMDYPSANQALFALVVMIIVLLFILVYCCSGAFPCSNTNSSEDSVTNVDPTGRRIRYPLLPRTRRRSPASDQEASRDRSSSRRSAVVIVPVNGIMYCCDDNADGSLSDSMRSKPPAYGDLFKAPPPYSVRTKTPSPTQESESVFPPAYEDSFKDWKLTFDNDNRFDSLHQSGAAEPQQVSTRRLNDLIQGASSGADSNNLTSNIINVLAKDYNGVPMELSRTATNSSIESRNTSRTFSRNEHPQQREQEITAFPSHTSYSADDLNSRISSSDEPPVSVNFSSRLSAEPSRVYMGPCSRQQRASRILGSHKFARSASANLPDDASYCSRNDLPVSGQRGWSTEGNRDLEVYEQQRQSTAQGGNSSGATLQTRPKDGSREALRFQTKFQDGSRDSDLSEQQCPSRAKHEFQQQPQSSCRKGLKVSSDYRKQISETDLDHLALASRGRNPDEEFTHRSEGHFDHLEMMNGRPISANIPLNDLNSEDHYGRTVFSSSPMNIRDSTGSPCPAGSRSCEDSENAHSTIFQASLTVQQRSGNHSRSSSDLHSTNNEQCSDCGRDEFHGRIHAPSFFGNPRAARAETAAEFQKETWQRTAANVLPTRVPDADVYSLIRDLTAAENQRRELPVLDRTKSCDSLDRQSRHDEESRDGAAIKPET